MIHFGVVDPLFNVMSCRLSFTILNVCILNWENCDYNFRRRCRRRRRAMYTE